MNMLDGQNSESLFGNAFDGAGASSLGGNDASSAIPGIQHDLTEQIENSKSQFPEYSTQYSSSDTDNPGELIQNFRLDAAGGSDVNVDATGDPSADQGNGFTSMGGIPSRRTNIPKQKSTWATKKQSVAYPYPYGPAGQNIVPFYNTLGHPAVPLQHLAAVSLFKLLLGLHVV
jgi:hypothetical protein